MAYKRQMQQQQERGADVGMVGTGGNGGEEQRSGIIGLDGSG